MCGICGVIDHNGDNKIGDALIRGMCAAMKHRGPDDEGVYIGRGEPSVGLGHRRLSIIDLSPAGHQPMSNEDGTLWIVLNGEIYNFMELRRDLEARGHKFRSNSDTETVVHAYEEYGEGCVARLRGMFAFAVWDERKKVLFAARDRVGKKPFLYYSGGGKFCFASEFGSLLRSGLVPKEIDRQAIHFYLSLGYVPAPLSIYKEVKKLMPGDYMVVSENGVSVKPYWRLDYSKKLKITEEDAASELVGLLKEAVKIRLHSDVPLGAFLSGGIDSSTIVALMSQVSDRKVKTFSIGFEEEGYSELKYARVIAERFATEHTELIVRPKAIDILPMLVERYGEPYADSSCIPTYYVSRQTRDYVTVALNGDGGDESFAGYERYQAMKMAESIARMHIGPLIKGLSGMFPDSTEPRNAMRRIKRFLSAAGLPPAERYLRWVGISGDVDLKGLYSREFRNEIECEAPLNMFRERLRSEDGSEMLDHLLRTDVETYLPNDLLVKVDIASMAVALEARSPLLDHKVMEFAAALPESYKMKRLVKKYLLKKAMAGSIPAEILNRRKMGFGMPVGRWLRGELNGMLRDTVLSKKALGRGYFIPAEVMRLVDEHSEGKKDYSHQLWALLMLELWHHKFIDGEPYL